MKLFKNNHSLKRKLSGKGLINKIINKLPFELHTPGYLFCGPGTKLKDKLNLSGINPLDSACKEHDLYYSIHPDTQERHKADLILQEKASARAKAADASLGEKITANFVKNTMKIKRALGAGVRRARQKKGGGLKKRNRGFGLKKRRRGSGLKKRRSGCRKRNSSKGGYLLPLLATALSAVNSYNSFKNGKKALALQKQQNDNLEKIVKGKGMYLKPFRGGGGRKRSKKRFLFPKGPRAIYN